MSLEAPATSSDLLTLESLESAKDSLNRLEWALQSLLFGQEELIQLVVVGLLARGHILLEGLPGLGKTELIKGLSKALGLEAKRIQFTPDLLPGDITGNPVLQDTPQGHRFLFQPGPLFAHFVLADEINRASPKTQSALLEAMQERRVTVMGESHSLPSPFFVLATQNPIELEGTYPLPEAQLDRFLFKLNVKQNPASVLEKIVLHREIGVEPTIEKVMEAEEFQSLLDLTRKIYLPQSVANFIGRLVYATQPGEPHSDGLKFGASPRAALALASAAKAKAILSKRTHASYEDVREVAPAVLRHRLILDYGAKLDGLTPDDVIARLLQAIPVQDKPLPHSLIEAKV